MPIPKINCRHCSWWLAAFAVLIAAVATAHDKPARAARTGLTFPTAMTLGPDNNLYISNFGFGFPPGSGQIVRVELSHSESEDD